MGLVEPRPLIAQRGGKCVWNVWEWEPTCAARGTGRLGRQCGGQPATSDINASLNDGNKFRDMRR